MLRGREERSRLPPTGDQRLLALHISTDDAPYAPADGDPRARSGWVVFVLLGHVSLQRQDRGDEDPHAAAWRPNCTVSRSEPTPSYAPVDPPEPHHAPWRRGELTAELAAAHFAV